jgi:hypothetical protein
MYAQTHSKARHAAMYKQALVQRQAELATEAGRRKTHNPLPLDTPCAVCSEVMQKLRHRERERERMSEPQIKFYRSFSLFIFQVTEDVDRNFVDTIFLISIL